MADIKNEVLWRVYGVLIMVFLMAMVIFGMAIKIQVIEGDKWRKKGAVNVRYNPVSAERGNIIAADGSLLATSLPFFEIRMDLNSNAMREEDFNDNVDSLAYCLANFVDNTWTVGGMRERLIRERAAGQRYLLIRKNVTYTELEKIEKFPLFNLGRYRGGFIKIQQAKRDRPFGILAHRTIGYIRDGSKKVGLEGFFDEELGGNPGKQLMQRVGPDTWIPVNDLTEIDPENGNDIITTLDVNLQEIAENALLRGIEYHDADHGSAILMEVKTGAIKAIANIGRTSSENKSYWETYNHAIGSAVEPGSTFKLAPMIALLEDGYIKLDDSIDLEQGRTMFYEEVMEDASFHNLDSTTIRNAFEISSNVGLGKLVQKYYGEGEKARDFVNRLRSFNLHLPTGIEIEGEAPPYIKEAFNKEEDWSGISLPWMSIGYEVLVTPLQLLTFYNAVANNGRMMRPYLVSEIQHFGESKKKYKPTVIKKQIASLNTIRQAQDLLLGAVENGTAKKLKTRRYKFAGKTGTAQVDYRKFTKKKKNLKHRASFAGYFPAKEPVYSLIVMVTNPRQHGIYGGEVAGPIFREISDKCFSSRIELHRALNEYAKPQLASKQLPSFDIGKTEEIQNVLDYFDVPFVNRHTENWAVIQAEMDTLNMYSRTIPEETVPNVVGMGLRDALFVLENRGLRVVVNGYGKVKQQSIIPGTRIKGQTIKLTLR